MKESRNSSRMSRQMSNEMENRPILKVEEVHTYYGQSHILQGVTLSLNEGAIVAVLGRNGVGKTTLVRSLIGFNIPREGRVYFKEKEITRLEPYNRVDAGIALVPQGRRIFGSLTVEENLLSSAKRRKKTRIWDQTGIYGLFPQLKERKKIRASHLSGGEQQMLAIGRALVSNPDLLLLDEPTEGLSPAVVLELIKILSQLTKEGLSILLVEQNLQFALNITDYLFILSMGKIVYQSTPSELSQKPEVQIAYLGVGQSEIKEMNPSE
jgi:branched-chain amino acid transport system ATP-binding protein